MPPAVALHRRAKQLELRLSARAHRVLRQRRDAVDPQRITHALGVQDQAREQAVRVVVPLRARRRLMAAGLQHAAVRLGRGPKAEMVNQGVDLVQQVVDLLHVTRRDISMDQRQHHDFQPLGGVGVASLVRVYVSCMVKAPRATARPARLLTGSLKPFKTGKILMARIPGDRVLLPPPNAA